MSDCRLATVIKVKESRLILKYSRSSACADCHSKDSCSFDQRDEEFSISYNVKNELYKVGDIVEISLNGKQKGKALFLAYLFPLMLFFLLAIVLSLLRIQEIIMALILLCFIIVYYVMLYFCRHKIKEVLTPRIRKVS